MFPGGGAALRELVLRSPMSIVDWLVSLFLETIVIEFEFRWTGQVLDKCVPALVLRPMTGRLSRHWNIDCDRVEISGS